MYKKGIVTVLLLLCVSLTLLAGCSGGGNDGNQASQAGSEGGTASSDGPVELRYMIWDQNQEPAYRKALDEFTKANPSIKVKIEVVPWSDYWKKLKTQAAGEVMPDLFWTYVGPIPDLVEKNLLMDLTPLTESVDMSKYNETLIRNLQYKGKTYGLPKDWDALAIYYNKDLLRKAGYEEVPGDLAWNPQDGGTFVQFLQKLTLDKNGKHPNEDGFDPKNIVQYGFTPTTIEPQGISMFVVGNGGKIQGENGDLEIDSPEAIEALTFVHDLVFKYHVAPKQSELTAMKEEAMFSGQRLATWMTGPWMMKPLQESTSFEWGIARNPEGPKGNVTRINGLTDSIYSKTKYPEQAKEAAKFLASQTTQDILGDTGTVFPAHKDSIHKFVTFYKDQGLDPSVFVEALNGMTVGDPASPKWDQVIDIWKKNLTLAFNGEMDIQEAIKTIAKEGNAIQSK
ncbi:ABC transporter substrate-binding protein [Paenibacillus sp. GCM10023252]|uniref:ABC transporter substrate-binding protein n=1 Tax=Paenibacillus sp. GCM10023252 TaxID=3252649 RepID=UPI003611908D